jgi:hypothetical protein
MVRLRNSYNYNLHICKDCFKSQIKVAGKSEGGLWVDKKTIIKLPSEGGILATWSAMNGSEVEIQVSNDKGEWEYNYGISDNDGHEFLPNVGMSQLFRIRVINDCRVGDWLIDP